jgi:hypothetical protein
MQGSERADTAGRPPAVVLVIRAWYEHDRFVARIIFEAEPCQSKASVVVGSIEALCEAVARAVEVLLPG